MKIIIIIFEKRLTLYKMFCGAVIYLKFYLCHYSFE
ncbi:hypothetical protein SASC598J21_019400 [Snodgrassella alvi SCGC AB-598-J21]|uniref:Uncharacterized protein n=1 Tax=Snodgrassella alvi SCGC AB-598-J21 TaxID=1385367 RepID=A0A074VYA2_9NEIS|nr:hypothetical protein SASC598J21_019400 [Snodgrassella alvi SCGC AB-598-J21]